MERGVAKHPLSMQDVEDARDELLSLVSAREYQGKTTERSALKSEKFRVGKCFHGIMPWLAATVAVSRDR